MDADARTKRIADLVDAEQNVLAAARLLAKIAAPELYAHRNPLRGSATVLEGVARLIRTVHVLEEAERNCIHAEQRSEGHAG